MGDSLERRTSELFPFGAQGSFVELPGPSPNLSAQGDPSLFCRAKNLHPQLLGQV